MECTHYTCNYSGKIYDLYSIIFKFSKNVKCISVNDKNDKMQVFIYSPENKIINSYSSKPNLYNLKNIIDAFLDNTYIFEKKETKIYNEYIVFSTHTYTFRAIIKEEPYHYSIKIGGKDFTGCLEIFIDKPSHPYYKPPKLVQVYSEPECWYHLEKKGDIVDLIKGSFQLCQMLFGADTFCFDDNSNIECGITNMEKKPPRKLEKPFSLAHLSISQKGKTWYENQFNAFLLDEGLRKKYNDSLKNLTDPIVKQKDDFDAFASFNRLTQDQYDFLKPIYTLTDTWQLFFHSIPKEKQCTMLFNWLPTFLETKILKFQPTKHQWCISLGIDKDLPEMVRTAVYINTDSNDIRQWGGKRKTIKKKNRSFYTRKQRIMPISFSNSYY
jgi:hypothetical protein